MTARQLILAALRAIGKRERGYTPTDEEMDEGLEALNLMLQTWARQDLLAPYRTITNPLTVAAGTRTYLLGSGEIWNIRKPQNITAAILIDGTERYPLVEMSEQQDVADPVIDTARPSAFFYERGVSNGTLWFDHTPDQAYTCILHTIVMLTTFATLDTSHSVPAEYLEVIKHQLALRLGPEYGITPPALVVAMAEQGLRELRAHNARWRIPTLELDAALLPQPTYNIEYD